MYLLHINQKFTNLGASTIIFTFFTFFHIFTPAWRAKQQPEPRKTCRPLKHTQLGRLHRAGPCQHPELAPHPGHRGSDFHGPRSPAENPSRHPHPRRHPHPSCEEQGDKDAAGDEKFKPKRAPAVIPGPPRGLPASPFVPAGVRETEAGKQKRSLELRADPRAAERCKMGTCPHGVAHGADPEPTEGWPAAVWRGWMVAHPGRDSQAFRGEKKK